MPALSETDRTALRQAKERGTLYQTRDEATQSFKQKYATEYRTSGFTSEPKVRPTYIPQTYTYNGAPRTIVYYNGGYGFWDGPTWRTYDFFADQAAMDMAMRSQGYAVSPYANQPQVIYAQPDNGWSFLKFLIVFGFIALFIAGCFWLANRD